MTSSSDGRNGDEHRDGAPARDAPRDAGAVDVDAGAETNQNKVAPPPSNDVSSTEVPDAAISAWAAAALELSASVLPSTEPSRPSTPARKTDAVDVTEPVQNSDTKISGDEPMPDAPIPVPVQDNANMIFPPEPAGQHPLGQFAPPNSYAEPQITSAEQQAFMMLALANLGNVRGSLSGPDTVTPYEVTLPSTVDTGDLNGEAALTTPRQGNTDKGLESFARIEFADSVFQMTTYAVIIGRDQRALEQARRDEKREDEYQRRVQENASQGLPPPLPVHHDRSKFSKSYVSEEGGMLGPESDSEESGRPAKRRRTSTNGSSQHDNEDSQENIISNRQYVSHTPGAAAVDLTSLRPSPWHVPFIAIHSPGPNIASKTKAISREHLKIAYNQDEGVFEAIPLHKNGFFCEDVLHKSEKLVLKCGDRLQIKDVDFCFIINGVDRGRTGAEDFLEEKPKKRQSQGGKEMSFDFEKSPGHVEVQDTSDELSEVEISAQELSDEEDGDDEPGEDGEDGIADDEGDFADDAEPRLGSSAGLDSGFPQIPKKRGPGRPPKNGIMSKREQRLLKKQQQELAKKALSQVPPTEPPIKRKVGRPRKHPLPEDGSERPEKRKYKPRKPREDGAEGSDAERRAREKKEKKARPKSPPLELKIEDYTNEQLSKPNKNYGVLIDETLTAAPDGLTLKQIYKRICQRYPWFYFHTETKGWESSVRHNLIGNEAFKKDETTNLWSRVPGVELDAGKKRKASSPDRNLIVQAFGPYAFPYNAAQHLPPGPPTAFPPGQTPQSYQVPGYPPQTGQMGQRPMQPYVPPPVQAAPAAQPGQANPSTAAPAQMPGYGPPPAPARTPAGVPQPGAYSSPYASRPPPPPPPPPPHAPSSTVPIKSEHGTPQPGVPPGTPQGPQAASVSVPAAASATPSATAAATQQTPATPGPRPSATPPTTDPARPIIRPPLLAAMVGLKNGLVENLKRARIPKAEAIVMSALNRCIGLKSEATENDKMETMCMKALGRFIDGWFTKDKVDVPGVAVSGSTHPVFETKALTYLNSFKDVQSKMLKETLEPGIAEALTLSAIDRVLGLADASIVPPGGEGTPTPSDLEGEEQRLMKTLRELLVGWKLKLRDT